MKKDNYYINKKKSYCISKIDSNEPIIYEGKKQYFRLKCSAIYLLKKLKKEYGNCLKIIDLRVPIQLKGGNKSK